ncbi:hypothetical protein IHE45_09G071700 [Dioscorea alata]|uniref:Uncharacterized protein n=1 Tax=Dioscorea alata TaxID=55571 RepID=A0ACB7VFW6_DIOAL|nr:hypothetical protein IHE45_09G071700 [Dioscorea alata]
MSQTLLLLPPFEAQSSTDEEDYIDIDITSSTTTTTFISFSLSPPHSKDFQFHFSSSSSSSSPKNPLLSTSPADELFYKGKLLPLHLPPRLQMVQTLLETNNSTPSFHSCNNISPSTSCHASGELNPNDFSFDSCSVSLVQSSQKKSWSKKLKRMKHSSLSYLKSLFSKSKCSDDSTAATAAASSQDVCIHRRSFSSAIKWHNPTKFSSSTSSLSLSSSSSSFSSASSSSVATPMLKRSSSVNSEVEISIQGAIAYCKKSQQFVSARKDFCR